MKTISFSIQKGGTAKSLSSQLTAEILGKKGYRVIVIDADGQCDFTNAVTLDLPEYNLYDVISNNKSVESAISKQTYYDLLVGSSSIYTIEQEKIDRRRLAVIKDKIIDKVSSKYDFCIIDTPPSLGNIQKMCIFASNYVVMPAIADIQSYNKIDAFNETIKSLQCNTSILGILISKYDENKSAYKQIKKMIAEKAIENGTSIFDCCIRESAQIQTAQATLYPIIDYTNKRCNTTTDFYKFIDEMLERIDK